MTDAQRLILTQGELDMAYEHITGLVSERNVYRSAIEGILDLPFAHAEVHNRYLHFVLDHRRMPTEEETMSQINCPALAADAPGGSDG